MTLINVGLKKGNSAQNFILFSSKLAPEQDFQTGSGTLLGTLMQDDGIRYLGGGPGQVRLQPAVVRLQGVDLGQQRGGLGLQGAILHLCINKKRT